MKQVLILMSLLMIFAYACNRNQGDPGGGGANSGMQKEESIPSGRSDLEKEDQNQMGSGTNTEE